jgi:hypothetical protein
VAQKEGLRPVFQAVEHPRHALTIQVREMEVDLRYMRCLPSERLGYRIPSHIWQQETSRTRGGLTEEYDGGSGRS